VENLVARLPAYLSLKGLVQGYEGKTGPRKTAFKMLVTNVQPKKKNRWGPTFEKGRASRISRG